MSAPPPLPGPALISPAGAQAPLAGAPRKGPSSLTIILAVVGACLLACVGLIALVALRPGPPGPDTPVTPVLGSDVSALLDQGDAALTTESLAAALASYEQALVLAPDAPQVIERLALVANAKGDWADAEAYATQLIDATASSNSQVALGYALLADALASQGDMTAALGEIDKALENDPEQALGHAILSNLRASRAEAIGSTAEMDVALASLDRAVDTIADETTLVEALTRNALGYTFGQEFQLSGDQEYYRQSEEQYQAAIDLLPTAGLLRSNLAYIKAAKERYDEARGDFEHAIEAGYAPAQAGIGWTYYHEGETAQAEAAFDKAIALDPDGPYGYFGKGRLRYDEQDYDGAIELLTQAVERSPRSPEIQSWLGEAALWKAFNSEDRAVKDAALSQAADAYRAALASDDRYIFAAGGLGWTLQYQEQYEESAALFAQAIALDPTNAAHYNGRGWSLFNLGRSEEAEADFRAALERNGSYVEAHYNLGRALEEQGRNDEARAAYQRALELNPEYQAAQERLDGLP